MYSYGESWCRYYGVTSLSGGFSLGICEGSNRSHGSAGVGGLFPNIATVDEDLFYPMCIVKKVHITEVLVQRWVVRHPAMTLSEREH